MISPSSFRKYGLAALITGGFLLAGCFHRSTAKAKAAPPAAAPEVLSVSATSSDGSLVRVRTGQGTDLYIITKGVGYPDASLSDKQVMQRQEKAQRDAIVEAQTKMLFVVSDFIMKSGITVGRKMQDDYDFTTRVNAAVNQAEVTDQYCSNDSVCTVTIRLKKRDFEKAIGSEVSR